MLRPGDGKWISLESSRCLNGRNKKGNRNHDNLDFEIFSIWWSVTTLMACFRSSCASHPQVVSVQFTANFQLFGFSASQFYFVCVFCVHISLTDTAFHGKNCHVLYGFLIWAALLAFLAAFVQNLNVKYVSREFSLQILRSKNNRNLVSLFMSINYD